MQNPDRKERQNKALEYMQTTVAETLNSDVWKAALDFRRRLQHPYSLSNLLLIYNQMPTASMVAGFKKWQTVGRQVRKGETGIMILAPLTKKTEEDDGTTTYRVFGFRTAYVFDVAQTDGDDVPTVPTPTILEGHAAPAEAAFAMLATLAATRGWTLNMATPAGGARGSWSSTTSTITVDPALPRLQQAKTLAHEIAHAMAGHTTSDDRALIELEAETAAYLVMDTLGLDTSAYTFAYLANWAGDAAALDRVLEAGRAATRIADDILNALPEPTPAAEQVAA